MFNRITWSTLLTSLICFPLSVFCTIPALAAERLTFSYPPFGEFELGVEDLEIFAKEGKVTKNFAFYAERVSPKELDDFRQLLNQNFNQSPVAVNNFFKTNLGKRMLQEINSVIDSPSEISQPFLEAAIIEAAASSEGLTILEVLKQYGGNSPEGETLRFNTQRVMEAVKEATTLFKDTERVFAALEQEGKMTATKNSGVDVSSLPDLSQPGSAQWQTESFTIPRPNRLPLNAVVYLPKKVSTPAPVVVIAPGLNSDIESLTYLCQHLASHGFGVAILDFPGSDTQRMTGVLEGFDPLPEANQWVDQPKDMTLLLDVMEQKSQTDSTWQGKLNLKQVGVLGQSLGGYTVTAIGGAQVEWDYLLKYCEDKNAADEFNFNIAALWQCKGANSTSPPTVKLQDERVAAVIAINPLTYPAFGPQGMAEMSVPVMLIGGSADVFAPALPEQILPFTWLKNADKYLVLVTNSTHFSFLGQGKQGAVSIPAELIGPDPSLARFYLKTLSVAFFRAHLTNQPEFNQYLSESYVHALSKEPLPITLIKSLSEAQVEQIIQSN